MDRPSRYILGGKPITISGSTLRVARIIEEEEHFYDVTAPEAIVSELKERNIAADLFSFWQRLPQTQPKFPYYFEWDNVAAVPVTTYENWLKKQIHENTRNKIRKAAKKGIQVQAVPFDDALVSGMVQIFNESATRQSRPFAHYGKSFETVKEEWSRDAERAEFIGAFFGSELVGFIKLLYADRYARTSGTISKLAHRDKAPMNALIARAVQICAERNLQYLIYGKFSYGKKGPDTLSEFKRYSGFEQINVPRYYIPLTGKGKVALACGLHKGLFEALPRPAVQAILQARNQWYQRKLSLARENDQNSKMRRVPPKGEQETLDPWKTYWEARGAEAKGDYDADHRASLDLEVDEIAKRELRAFISPDPCDRVLDAGCGTGGNISNLSGSVSSIVGIDYSDQMVSRAQRRIVNERISNAEVRVGSIVATGLPNDSFDKIICISVMQYLDDDACVAALKEFVRVGRDGAIIVLHIKNLASLYLLSLWAAKKLKSFFKRPVKIEYYRTQHWYENKLRRAGAIPVQFDANHIFVIDFLPRRLYHWIVKMERKHYHSRFLRRYGSEYFIKATVRKDGPMPHQIME